MVSLRVASQSVRKALSALLMLVLALAPFEARFMMAAHAGSHEQTASTSTSTHDHTQHATGHHDQASHNHNVLAHHDGVQAAADDVTGSAPEHHDHSGGPDGACCGTFCHSACIDVAILDIPNPSPSMAFDRLTATPLIAVAQGQLQRPPQAPCRFNRRFVHGSVQMCTRPIGRA